MRDYVLIVDGDRRWMGGVVWALQSAGLLTTSTWIAEAAIAQAGNKWPLAVILGVELAGFKDAWVLWEALRHLAHGQANTKDQAFEYNRAFEYERAFEYNRAFEYERAFDSKRALEHRRALPVICITEGHRNARLARQHGAVAVFDRKTCVPQDVCVAAIAALAATPAAVEEGAALDGSPGAAPDSPHAVVLQIQSREGAIA